MRLANWGRRRRRRLGLCRHNAVPISQIQLLRAECLAKTTNACSACSVRHLHAIEQTQPDDASRKFTHSGSLVFTSNAPVMMCHASTGSISVIATG